MISNNILLVDDDPVARTLIRIALVKNQYCVMEADSSTAALDLWNVQKKNIQLLLTDLAIPGGLDGREVAARILADEPSLPVIYISSHRASMTGKEEANLVQGVNFLAKPVNIVQLIEIVKAALKRSPAPINS